MDAASLQDIEWSAFKQSFVEEKNLIVLAGNAWVRYKGAKLEADNIVFYKTTREMYAEGNARLRIGESEISADKAYIDISRNVGYLTDATVRVSAPPHELLGKKKKGASATDPKAPETPGKTEAYKKEASKLDKLDIGFTRTRDPYGVYVNPSEDPQARTNLIFRAEKLIIQSQDHLSADTGFMTTDDMVHPMYGVKTGELDLYLEDDPKSPGQLRGKKVVAKAAQLTILGVSLFPFPTITVDLVRHNPFFQFSAGKSSRWGAFGLARFGYATSVNESALIDPTHIYLDLDERDKRGPGAGFEVEWRTGSRPAAIQGEREQFERGTGHIRFFTIDEVQISGNDALRRARQDLERRLQPKIDGFPRRTYDANMLFLQRRKLDNAGPPSFSLDRHEDDFRGYVDFQHHQPLKRIAGIDNILLDFKYERQSDRDFMLEYFQKNYMEENQPEALASVRKPGDNYSIELLYRHDPQDFEGGPPRSPVAYGSFTGYEPALTYNLSPMPLPYGFNLSAETQAARMRRNFDRDLFDQSEIDSGRVYGILDVTRPFKFGVVNFVPHLGTQQAEYDRSRDGGSVNQGAATYGLDATTRFYGTFADVDNEALGIKGLRHILEPRISYSGVSSTQADPLKLYDFDHVDDLVPIDKVTFALDQTFQTRKMVNDNPVATNFAGLDMAVDYYPRERDQRRLLDNDSLDLVRTDGFIRVLDVAKLDAGAGFNMEDGNVEKTAYGISIDPQGRWRLRFEERYNFKDTSRKIIGSDQFRLKFDYELSERWSVGYEQVLERRKSLLTRRGRQLEKFTVTRSYGGLDASFSYGEDRNIGDHSVFFTVRPNPTYRNLIVPTQDLLVSSSQVASEDIETPEEQNFDPFEMMRQRRGAKKKAKGDSGTPGSKPAPDGATVPAPAPDQNLPVPPPPAADKRVGSSDLFKDPKAAPRKVDEDDWVTPPPTPASTR